MDPSIIFLQGKEATSLDDWFILVSPSNAKFITTTSGNNDEDIYGIKQSYERVFSLRNGFNTLSYKNARLLGNPFENITHQFIDRAGLKLANLDFICNIVTDNTRRFADVAGAPGAFTEYILWRQENRGIAVRGYGISLKTSKKELNWKIDKSSLLDLTTDVTVDTIKYRTPLSDFLVTFGADGKGDILKKSNVKSFVDVATQGEKLDLVIADAAIDVSGEENLQEKKNRHLMLAQTIIALESLKQKAIPLEKKEGKKKGKGTKLPPDSSEEGGTFVMKIFDAYTRYMVDVINLIACHFTTVSIVKPITSRMANSERYLVAKGYKGLNVDILELWKTIKEDGNSFLSYPHPVILDYIVRMNDYTAQTQSNALEWIYEVDKWLIAGYENVSYPIYYDLTRANKLWGIGYSDMRPGKIVSYLDVSLEIRRFGLIASVFEKLTNMVDRDIRGIFSAWLQYSSAHGNPPERFTLALATKFFGKDNGLFEAIKDAYDEVEDINDIIITKFSADSSVVITAHTINGGYYRTYKVPSSIFNLLERRQGNYYNNQAYLRRAFSIFKRYETLCTFDTCWNWRANYFSQSPEDRRRENINNTPKHHYKENNIDIELYSTRITSSAPVFFSPFHDIEYEVGSIGYPLGDLPREPFSFNNKRLGLNLMLCTSDRLRKELINRIFIILDNENSKNIRLYVLTDMQDEKLLESSYYTGIIPLTKVYHIQKGESVKKDAYILTLVKL